MSTPALSILLPNYNHSDFLPRCIEAILSQSFGDFELIVIDDSSTDDSLDVIQDYARQDSRVRAYQNPQNKGVIYTLTRALGLARAELVFGAAADDYVLPGYFGEAMNLLRAHPQAGMALGLTEAINHAGHITGVTPGLWSPDPGYLTPDEVAVNMTTCGVPGPAIWKKAAFLEAGGYRADLRWHGDWFPLQVVAFRYGVCFIPRIVSVVREVEASYSSNQRKAKVQRTVLQNLIGMIGDPEYRDVLPFFVKSGVLRQFGPELLRAAASDPSFPDVVLPALQPLLIGHTGLLLTDKEPEVRAGAARLLAQCGPEAFPHVYEMLGTMKANDSNPAVREAVRQARTAIRQSLPKATVWKHHMRRAIGSVIRTADRVAHPLHHRRLERMEVLMTEMLRFQQHEMYQAMSALYHQLEAIKQQGRAAESDRGEAHDRTGHSVAKVA